MARTYKRKHARNPDRRMAAAARLRAQGMSLRQIAGSTPSAPTPPRRQRPVPDDMTLACQWGRCQDCGDPDECVCDCHIDPEEATG